MASGTLLVESIEDQPDSNLSYQKLESKVDCPCCSLLKAFRCTYTLTMMRI